MSNADIEIHDLPNGNVQISLIQPALEGETQQVINVVMEPTSLDLLGYRLAQYMQDHAPEECPSMYDKGNMRGKL